MLYEIQLFYKIWKILNFEAHLALRLTVLCISHRVSEVVDMSSGSWLSGAGEGERSGKFCGEVTFQLSLKTGYRSTLGTRQEKARRDRGRGSTRMSLAEIRSLKSSCVYPRSSQHIVSTVEGPGQICILGRSRWAKYSFKCLTGIQNHSESTASPIHQDHAWKWSCFGMVCLAPLNF